MNMDKKTKRKILYSRLQDGTATNEEILQYTRSTCEPDGVYHFDRGVDTIRHYLLGGIPHWCMRAIVEHATRDELKGMAAKLRIFREWDIDYPKDKSIADMVLSEISEIERWVTDVGDYLTEDENEHLIRLLELERIELIERQKKLFEDI